MLSPHRALPFLLFFFYMIRPLPRSTLFPYTTLFRSLSRPQPLSAAQSPDDHGGLDRAEQKQRAGAGGERDVRSEEHTSELQSHSDLVCRLLLEKKKKNETQTTHEEHNPT